MSENLLEVIEWQFSAYEPYGLQVQDIWSVTNGSLHIRVAVLDSGIHSLARERGWFENLENGYDFVSDPAHALDGNGRDEDSSDPGDSSPQCPQSSWHGTKMAFGIAGKHNVMEGLHSMAWNTTIQPLRVLGLCSTGYANDVTDAIVWAAGGLINGLGVNPTPAQIISMSLGGQGKCPSYLQSAINMAVNQNIPIIVAAGNQATDAEDFFPANCEGVIVVTATTANGFLAKYSNRGPKTTVSAPGGDFDRGLSSVDFNFDQPVVVQSYGTSFSTCFASGFAALALSLDSSANIFLTLRQSVTMINPLENQCFEGQCGGGILNAHNLVLNNTHFNITFPVFNTSHIEDNPKVQAQYCSTGSWSASGSTVCYGCSEGQYSTVSGATSLAQLNCLQCPTGTYSSTGSSVCSGCVVMASSAVSSGAGTVTTDVPGYYVHKYAYVSGGYSVTFRQDVIADVLVIGGGAGASKGGGGAGAVIYSSGLLFTANTPYTLTVGAGGASTTNGQDSSVNGVTARGGGRGGDYSCGSNGDGKPGGSGGGGGTCLTTTSTNAAGSATNTNINFLLTGYIYGNSGGTGKADPNTNCIKSGGGGGAGTAGSNGCCSCVGDGGDGVFSATWAGSTVYFQAAFGLAYTSTAVLDSVSGNYYVAGGGGGGGRRASGSSTITTAGGLGGGGNGKYDDTTVAGGSGVAGTGSGGGGWSGTTSTGSPGGSGTIFIRYKTCQSCPSGKILTSGTCVLCTSGKYSGFAQTVCQSCPLNSASPPGADFCSGLQGYSLSYSGATSVSTSSNIAVSFPNTLVYFFTTSSRFFGIQVNPYAFIQSGSGTILISDMWPSSSTTAVIVYKSSLSFALCTGTCTGGQPHCAIGGTSKICCGPGYYFQDDYDVACQICPSNTFSTTGAATACTSCTAPLVSLSGSSVCVECIITVTCTASQTKRCVGTSSNVCCSAGQYFVSGNTLCQSCTAGKYTIDGSFSVCSSCTTGSFNSMSTLSTCTQCSVGFYQDTTSQTTCKQCSTGLYQNVVAQSTCKQCSTGLYQDVVAQSTCKQCSTGLYQDVVAQSTCKQCSTGLYQDVVAQSTCKQCSTGLYQDVVAQSTCKQCSTGLYQDVVAQSTCKQCFTGLYQDVVAQSTCKQCSTGLYQDVVAQSSCKSCSAGSYQDTAAQSTCKECSINYYCPPESIAQVPCKTCDQVYLTSCSTLGLTNDVVTCACASGYYLGNPQAVIKCTSCPMYTTSVLNNTDISVYSCRCIPGYACKYTKQIYATVKLNMPLIEFDSAAQELFKQLVGRAANVTSDKVTISAIYSTQGNRRLLAMKNSIIIVEFSVRDSDHLHHELIRKFTLHSQSKKLFVLDVQWRKTEHIQVQKILNLITK